MNSNSYIRSEDTVFLVVDKTHPRYGQIGEMVYGHRVINGGVGIRFLDGKTEEFSGRLNRNRGGDFNLGLKTFYRHLDDRGEDFDKKNSAGPRTFIKIFLEMEFGNLEILSEQYFLLFGEDLPITENEPARI